MYVCLVSYQYTTRIDAPRRRDAVAALGARGRVGAFRAQELRVLLRARGRRQRLRNLIRLDQAPGVPSPRPAPAPMPMPIQIPAPSCAIANRRDPAP